MTERKSEQRQREIVALVVLFFVSSGIVFWTSPLSATSPFFDVTGKFGLALMIAAVVRLATLLLAPTEPKGDIYQSSKADYETALKDARNSVWICQTWLPGGGTHERWLLEGKPQLQLRLLLSSFKPESHIRSRIAGREDIAGVSTAMSNVFNCAAQFAKAKKQSSLRFNYGHHPGWITIIDNRDVYWGPTPVDVDNNTHDYFFHKDAVDGTWGKFWKKQFELLWNKHSHNFDEEMQYNEYLRS